MSKQSELYALRHSFSGDSPVTTHNRSGDSEGDGAERWNFIASVQSAEADIIDEEERVEQQEAKRKFVKLLGLYFKKILTPIEYEFLKECLKGELTPHKVGLKLGINYIQFIINIKAKNIANKQNFLLLMQYSGYDFRHGLEFLPKLEQKYKDYVRTQKWYYSNHERALINSAEWKRLHPDRVKIHKHNAYLVRKSKGKIKKWPYTETKRLYQEQYRLENKEKIREQRKAYRARPEIKQKNKERLRKWQQEHKEQAKISRQKYEAAHREKINARRRLRRAEAKLSQNYKEKRRLSIDEIKERKKEYNLKRRQNLTPEQLEAKRERDRLAQRRRRQNLTPEQLEAKHERDRLRQRKYNEQNREKVNERQRQYRAKPENKQKRSEYAKRWYELHRDEINARKREKRATETKNQKELRNKQRRLRAAEKREIKLRETKKSIQQKQSLLVEKFCSLEALLRSMSYEFICKIWANCTETIKGETPDPEQSELYFKAFYNSVYTTVNSIVQELKETLTDNAPKEDENSN